MQRVATERHSIQAAVWSSNPRTTARSYLYANGDLLEAVPARHVQSLFRGGQSQLDQIASALLLCPLSPLPLPSPSDARNHILIAQHTLGFAASS
eukprot:752454-Hanusia_phi.AAC.2